MLAATVVKLPNLVILAREPGEDLPFIDVLCDHCQVEDVEVRDPTSRCSALPSPRGS